MLIELAGLVMGGAGLARVGSDGKGAAEACGAITFTFRLGELKPVCGCLETDDKSDVLVNGCIITKPKQKIVTKANGKATLLS